MTDGTGFRASGTALCLAGAQTGYVAGADVVQLLLGAEYRPSPEKVVLVAGEVGGRRHHPGIDRHLAGVSPRPGSRGVPRWPIRP